jgi:hypothetical protein
MRHILLLDFDLNRPGEKGAIRIALGLGWRGCQRPNSNEEHKRRNECFGAMIA